MSNKNTDDNEWGINEIGSEPEKKESKYDFNKTENMPDHEIIMQFDDIENTESSESLTGTEEILPVEEVIYEEAPEEVNEEEVYVEELYGGPKDISEDDEEYIEEPEDFDAGPVPVVKGTNEEYMDEEDEEEVKDKKAFIISAVVALVLIIIVGIFIVVKLIDKNNEKNRNNEDNSQRVEIEVSGNQANQTQQTNQSSQSTSQEQSTQTNTGNNTQENKPEDVCKTEGHDYAEATCTSPKTCKVCGETEGEPLPHDYADATCTSAKKCKNCGATEGSPLGHDYGEATCTEAAKCTRCGEEGTGATGHTYKDATCTEPKTCKNCGATEGEALGHNYSEATCSAPKTCSRCNATEGTTIAHTYQITSETSVGNTKTTVYTCSVCGATKTEETQIATSSSDYLSQVVELMNADRAANGVGPIAMSADLNAAAAKRAEEIATYFSHTRPDGTSCFTVLDGMSYTTAGENIAYGYSTPSAVETAWMNSDGHRANILNGSFGHVGIGYYVDASGTAYWVQIFTN